ncbi:hypothetical protein ACP70R_030072 [Stipagrostis hirtigluma subsp. patula]
MYGQRFTVPLFKVPVVLFLLLPPPLDCHPLIAPSAITPVHVASLMDSSSRDLPTSRRVAPLLRPRLPKPPRHGPRTEPPALFLPPVTAPSAHLAPAFGVRPYGKGTPHGNPRRRIHRRPSPPMSNTIVITPQQSCHHDICALLTEPCATAAPALNQEGGFTELGMEYSGSVATVVASSRPVSGPKILSFFFSIRARGRQIRGDICRNGNADPNSKHHVFPLLRLVDIAKHCWVSLIFSQVLDALVLELDCQIIKKQNGCPDNSVNICRMSGGCMAVNPAIGIVMQQSDGNICSMEKVVTVFAGSFFAFWKELMQYCRLLQVHEMTIGSRFSSDRIAKLALGMSQVKKDLLANHNLSFLLDIEKINVEPVL